MSKFHIIKADYEGKRLTLCQDSKFRFKPGWGTVSCCAKVYQRKGCAENFMKKMSGKFSNVKVETLATFKK